MNRTTPVLKPQCTQRSYFFYRGFTAIEIIGVLGFMCFLISTINRLKNDQLHTRQINQLADQSRYSSVMAVKYIQDNYRTLVQQVWQHGDIVIPHSVFLANAPPGNSAINIKHQLPCLYISNGFNQTIKVYMIFGNITADIHPLSSSDIGEISQVLGGNAANLTLINQQYIISGYTENELKLSPAVVNNILKECNFITPLPVNNLIINLSKNIALFASIKGNIDKYSTPTQADPSLKKSTDQLNGSPLTTMQTNIYLDNIIRESTFKHTYYCDAAKLPQNDANSVCLSYAASQNISMYPGSAAWFSSVLDLTAKQCIATAKAHFYNSIMSNTCSGVSYGDANTYCRQKKGVIAANSGYWYPNPGSLSGSQCYTTPYASYTCRTWRYWYNICHNEVSITCTSGTIYTINGSCPPAGTRMPCNGQIWWVNDPPPSCAAWQPPQACSTQVAVPAKSTQVINDLGFKAC